MKKPNVPGEEQGEKGLKKFASIAVLIGTMKICLVLVENYGIINSDNFKMLTFSIFEGIINFLVPLAYVSSVPNMKDYLLNTTTEILDCIISKIALAFADIYNLATALTPSPRIYPTIEYFFFVSVHMC